MGHATGKAILCGLLLATCLYCCEALQCLRCDYVPDPGDCTFLETCKSNEQCISQKYMGSNMATYYSLGCANSMVCQQILVGKRETPLMTVSLNKTELYEDRKISVIEEYKNKKSRKIKDEDKYMSNQTYLSTGVRSVGDISVCSQCCNTDVCNRHLCVADTNTRLLCLSCNDVQDPKDCDQVQQCQTNSNCYVQKGLNQYIASYVIRYHMGCLSELQCNAFKHVFKQNCVVCCNNTDLCNYGACDNWQPQSVTTSSAGYGLSTMMHVPFHPTTTTTAPTTTMAPSVTINAPLLGDFNANISLKCITFPAAQSYDWKKNTTSTLPPGVTPATHSTLAGAAGINILTISHLNESTMGEYTCIATTNGHVIQATHFIDIKPAPPTVSIEKAISSNAFTFKCTVGGYPRSTIVWDFKPSGIGLHGLPPGLQFSDDGREAFIYVGDYRPIDHNGNWSCRATNSVGTAIGTITIP